MRDSAMLIRPATLADAAAIEEIYRHFVLTSTATYQEDAGTLEEREAWLNSHGPNHPVWVMEIPDAGVIGWGALSPFHPRSAYRFTVEDSLYLRDGWQGRGLGKNFLQHMITAARKLGHVSMIALISHDQTASIRLHENAGFKHAGHLQDVGWKFEKWLSLDFWQLMLR